MEFSDLDYLPLLRDYDNLIIGRTFSKAYSLAGLRVGYAFVPEWFRPYYLRAATPHTLNAVSAAAAVGALSDMDHVESARKRVQRLEKGIIRAVELSGHAVRCELCHGGRRPAHI